MVNDDTRALLERLRTADAPLSGEALARELGVSRVALWKRVEALRAAGYPVEAGRRGYRLGRSDKPLPWEFPGDEATTFHFDTLESTMDEALRRGWDGAPEGVVVAEHQTQGRGRADRSWTSAGGDLLVTQWLRPALPAAFAGSLALEALTLMSETLEELYGLDVRLKWPNDLVVGERKVGGLLVETFGAADRPRLCTVGLGLNVHGLPATDRPAASVGGLAPQADRRTILARWRHRLAAWAASPQLVPARWARRAALPPRVTLETFEGLTVSGVPLGFDRAGGLLLGGGETIRYGESRRTLGATT